jgi:hypothetical protein
LYLWGVSRAANGPSASEIYCLGKTQSIWKRLKRRPSMKSMIVDVGHQL